MTSPSVVAEGVTSFVYASGGPGRVPVRRYYNPATDEHFWTASPTEIPDPSSGLMLEGIVFWTPAPGTPNTVPMYRVRCIQCFGF